MWKKEILCHLLCHSNFKLWFPEACTYTINSTVLESALCVLPGYLLCKKRLFTYGINFWNKENSFVLSITFVCQKLLVKLTELYDCLIYICMWLGLQHNHWGIHTHTHTHTNNPNKLTGVSKLVFYAGNNNHNNKQVIEEMWVLQFIGEKRQVGSTHSWSKDSWMLLVGHKEVRSMKITSVHQLLVIEYAQLCAHCWPEHTTSRVAQWQYTGHAMAGSVHGSWHDSASIQVRAVPGEGHVMADLWNRS